LGDPVVVVKVLLSEAERRDDLAVAVEADALEVIEEAAALRDELEQSAAGVVVFDVGLEVLREVADTRGKERDLNFGRPGVALVGAELVDEARFLFCEKGHCCLVCLPVGAAKYMERAPSVNHYHAPRIPVIGERSLR
jgi:hypothetical protein